MQAEHFPFSSCNLVHTMYDLTLTDCSRALAWSHLCTEKRAVKALGCKAHYVLHELGPCMFISRAISFAVNHGLSKAELQFSPFQF